MLLFKRCRVEGVEENLNIDKYSSVDLNDGILMT